MLRVSRYLGICLDLRVEYLGRGNSKRKGFEVGNGCVSCRNRKKINGNRFYFRFSVSVVFSKERVRWDWFVLFE